MGPVSGVGHDILICEQPTLDGCVPKRSIQVGSERRIGEDSEYVRLSDIGQIEHQYTPEDNVRFHTVTYTIGSR